MHRRRALVLLPLILALACSPGGDQVAPQPAPAGSGAPADGAAGGNGGASEGDQPTGDATEDDGTVTAQPSAELSGTCTPNPRTTDGVNELVADLQVVNTGNLGVKVYVLSRWPMGRTGGVARSRRVNVPQGETVSATLRLVVDDATARAVRRGIARGRKCSARSRVVGAYGVPE